MKKVNKPKENWNRVFPSFPVIMASMEHKGKKNIITLGLFHQFSFNPPIIGIGVSPTHHSYGMIRDSGQFVINVPIKELVPQTLFCGIKSGKTVDKFKETGFTAKRGKNVRAPLIVECPVNLECRVINEYKIGDHQWFIGMVEKIHIDDKYDRNDAVTYWAGQFRMMGEIVGKRE